MIRFACPGCGAIFTVPDEKAGKTGKCPKCQGQFVIPEPDRAAAPPAPGPSVEIAPCPGCQAKLSVGEADLGASVECPYCKTVYSAERPGPPPSRRSAVAEVPARPRDDDDRPARRGRPRDDDDTDDEPADRPARRGRKRAAGTVVIRRVGVLALARTMGLMYAILGLVLAVPYGLFMLVIAAGAAGAKNGGAAAAGLGGIAGVCVVVLFPVIYGAAGYIAGAILALLYNFAAKQYGGVEVELD